MQAFGHKNYKRVGIILQRGMYGIVQNFSPVQKIVYTLYRYSDTRSLHIANLWPMDQCKVTSTAASSATMYCKVCMHHMSLIIISCIAEPVKARFMYQGGENWYIRFTGKLLECTCIHIYMY